MNKLLTSIIVGCALSVSAVSAPLLAAGQTTDNAGTQHSADADAAMSHGEIKKVDAAAGKLTIKHGPLTNLGMGAMTMVFKVKDPSMLNDLKVGDKIDFVAEEINGALTVTQLHKQ